MNTKTYCSEYALVKRMNRRAFFGNGLKSAAGLLYGHTLGALPNWMPRISLANPHLGPAGDTLVCLFLRGGADGLNIVVPHGDEGYYEQRPTLAIPRPDDHRAGAKSIDLDGFFALHPALEPLSSPYQAGDLAFVHATGSPDESRSHFEAMSLMERGLATSEYTGWLARHLAALDTSNDSALRAIAVGNMLPASLTGSVNATALKSIADYHLRAPKKQQAQMSDLLQKLYHQHNDLLTAAATQTFATIELLRKVDTTSPPKGRAYPTDEVGQGLRIVAQLIEAEVGVEVACLDFGGWDTHAAQGSSEGQMARLLHSLGQALIAFYEDLQSKMNQITLVVMSEFGRRVHENSSQGTDHGHGNMMLLMGGGIVGKQVFTKWPGLQPEQLTSGGDLAITTDYRDVLGEIVRKRLNNPRLAEVFPGYTVEEHGLAVVVAGGVAEDET